jgi:RNA polymerase sigma-70 factor, ECF subfamily
MIFSTKRPKSPPMPPHDQSSGHGVNWDALPDEVLVQQLKLGHEEALSVLVTRHQRRFYSLAYRYLSRKQDAEDIVQDAFLRLWKHPEVWQDDRSTRFTTWFYRIIVNLCLDELRRKKPMQIPEGWDTADTSESQDTVLVLETRRQQALLEKAIAQLPERQRTALNLCFYEDISNQEAADIMGVPIKTLQSLLMRAKQNLKENLKDFV